MTVLTPYMIPPSLMGRKFANLGDGFILRAIERLIGRFSPQKTFSPRAQPSAAVIDIIKSNQPTILAGANQLNHRYTIWPRLTADYIRENDLRLIPFGIGIHGEQGQTDTLSIATKEILRAVHERIDYSSWRCPNTLDFLKCELPELAPQLLMTGCPVIYDQPLLKGAPFEKETRRIAVTPTERHDFWARETAIIDFVARIFPRANRYLVLHQNYSPPTRLEHIRHRWLAKKTVPANDYEKLRWYATQRGFRIICPSNPDAGIEFYRKVDLHIGTRLHAHLLCLSQAKRSVLVPIDERSSGIAKAFGFDLYATAELERALDFDFESVRAHALERYSVMQKFLTSLNRH